MHTYAFEKLVSDIAIEYFEEKGIKYVREMETGLQPLDFYLPDHNCAIEIDGTSHFYGLSKHQHGKNVFK